MRSGLRAVGGDNGVPLLKGIACEKGSEIRVVFCSNSSEDYWSRILQSLFFFVGLLIDFAIVVLLLVYSYDVVKDFR